MRLPRLFNGVRRPAARGVNTPGIRDRLVDSGPLNPGRSALSLAATSLALLAASVPLAAQQGTITYNHVVKRELPPGFAQRMREPPPPQTNTMVLHFSPTVSLMVRGANQRREGEGGRRFGGGGDRAVDGAGFRDRRGGGRFGFGFRPGMGPDQASTLQAAYVDYGEGTLVEGRRFLGRDFRVTRERPSYGWRIGVEQAEHLGYTVMRATAEHDSTTVEAWFTPQIPVPGGPASYGGLPGMILVLSLNDGQTQYQATEVALTELEAGLIGPPEEGDEVSYEEFEQLVKERLEEMTRSRRPPGSDGGLRENEQ
ncbi:MAG: GLPGLI family protein [Gemmatimonadetes bacterium]|nr:GLPGLI family protein [Gemmatimonadota bacterium]MYA63947.1 GLPGLI family protein [Gemmatimonadota bacterium]MYB98799.1 GLPGLI family protein [Gemmatimonadota bacterium]MYH52792.1 GLPGLI family protein [Gemmatimonadota bacterium]MYI46501.1 GLPGLI family protein [Gemmatimonadota bacterium]